MKIMAIESSCDETAAAVVEDGVKSICSVVASSKELHEKTGGVVPEIAARKQVEFILPVLEETLNNFKKDPITSIDAVAVTVGPGLVGSLVVGIEAAKALSLVWNKPLIPVNHLVGHIYANFIDSYDKKIEFPAVALLVSGGHTNLILIHNHGKFDYLGGTLDDAAGEAFDKTARLLGLSRYLGGVLLSKKASECVLNTLEGKLPRPMMNQDNFDFSFSGLKTAVKRLADEAKYPQEVIACEFENAVVDVLVSKTIKAVKRYSARTILLGGGVAANTNLRSRIVYEAEKIDTPVYIPPIELCTDNAVYIASAAYFAGNKTFDYASVKANPSMGIMDLVIS